jgi:hypothetical protein
MSAASRGPFQCAAAAKMASWKKTVQAYKEAMERKEQEEVVDDEEEDDEEEEEIEGGGGNGSPKSKSKSKSKEKKRRSKKRRRQVRTVSKLDRLVRWERGRIGGGLATWEVSPSCLALLGGRRVAKDFGEGCGGVFEGTVVFAKQFAANNDKSKSPSSSSSSSP